ncbi:Protein CBG27341 [Caenorhabditis briggsae]|uniref:Protein CBG27341 n=1 Tax=Caenorhabditis briggsae TaxID=6238 RepID=B6IGE2_CAEBR|nr:Protein CBG27341 [Caenorhabditis briggsae]CAR98972.1 Protein CBG27341 [Caenorhabditis briggsae]
MPRHHHYRKNQPIKKSIPWKRVVF